MILLTASDGAGRRKVVDTSTAGDLVILLLFFLVFYYILMSQNFVCESNCLELSSLCVGEHNHNGTLLRTESLLYNPCCHAMR